MNQIDKGQSTFKMFFSTLFILTGLVLFSSCTSTETDISNAVANGPADRTSVSSNGSSSSTPLDPSGKPELPIGMNEHQKKRIEEAFAASAQVPDGTVHPGLKAKPASRPAPDNSEYFSTLTDVATETREFKGHPVLKKVERITSGSDVKLRIHLRSGRVIDADGKNVTNMPVASASTFMQIGGLPRLATPSPPPGSSSSSSKKKQQDSARDADLVPNNRTN